MKSNLPFAGIVAEVSTALSHAVEEPLVEYARNVDRGGVDEDAAPALFAPVDEVRVVARSTMNSRSNFRLSARRRMLSSSGGGSCAIPRAAMSLSIAFARLM